jgi:hypothetical protein
MPSAARATIISVATRFSGALLIFFGLVPLFFGLVPRCVAARRKTAIQGAWLQEPCTIVVETSWAKGTEGQGFIEGARKDGSSERRG